MLNFKEELKKYQPLMELDDIQSALAAFSDAGSAGHFTAYCKRKQTTGSLCQPG